jgi:O-antigen/teichoic acid export membrane protein
MTFVLYPNINQILINMYMSTENLGLYNAYSFASVNIASLIFNIFNGVFFPVASKCKDKTVILKRINRIAPYLIIFGTIFIIIVEFIILNIYGSKYTIKIPLLFSFAILSILIVYYGTYNWTFSSEGLDGVKLVNKTSILIAIINVILAMFFIPYLGLIGATISTSIALVIGVYFLLSKGKYFKYDKI